MVKISLHHRYSKVNLTLAWLLLVASY